MSAPTKDNAHILANQEAFQEAYARARAQFGQIEGVVGVAFGQKKTEGQYKDDIAIVVFVREKKDEKDLPADQRIPPSFEGYPTDVRIVRQRKFDACDNTAKFETIQGGIQISGRMDNTGHFEQGTLGCIVKRRGDSGRENVYLLSNLHVLFGRGATDKDNIYHPFPPTINAKQFVDPGPHLALGRTQPDPVIGNVPFLVPGDVAPTLVFVDCAIARINIDSKCCGSTCTQDDIKHDETIIDLQLVKIGATLTNYIGGVRSVVKDQTIIGRKVYKVGRTTGRTVGIVRLINAPADAPPDPRTPGGTPISALNTIEIDFDPTSTASGVNCKGNARFTEDGDSGSLVLDEDGRAIGLHSLGAPPGSPSTFPANACHIMPVLESLKICIPTKSGTDHGCCAATDGSGIALAPVADLEAPDGQIVFASQQMETANARSPGFPDPAPLSVAEVDHMRDLLATFRETAKGRELHEVFGDVRREIGYLIRNCRPVKVAWHRNQGPAFFAHVLNHLKGHADEVPSEVKGVSREALLTRMAEVLTMNGSNPLRRAIEQYSEEFTAVIPSLNTARDCIDYLREKENS